MRAPGQPAFPVAGMARGAHSAAMTDGHYFPATAMPDADWWHALWPDPQGVLGRLGVAPGMAVLDMCCGDGYFTAALGAIVGAGGRVCGVDLDPAMLAKAEARALAAGLGNCTWIEADAGALEGRWRAAFDHALIANTFHGVPDKTGLAAGVASALKPGGLFAIVNWHARRREETPVLGAPRGPPGEVRMTPEATREAVEPAGFVLERVVELAPYHYGAVFREDSA